MTKSELKNKIGEYIQTGLKLIAVGSKYAYYYSIWDSGTGKCTGYCRKKINGYSDYTDLEFIPKSKVRIK